jgi:hypothetical protein
MKTEARGFYIDTGDDKLSGYGDNSKKSTEIGSVSSNKQLPFLIYTHQGSGDETNRKYNNTISNPNNNRKKVLVPTKQTFNIKNK